MDLVDEEHVSGGQLGEDRCEVPRPLKGRTRGDVKVGPDLGSHDSGQRRLAQAGGACKKKVIYRLRAASGGFEDDTKPVLQLGLSNEFFQRARAQVWPVVDGLVDLDFDLGRLTLEAKCDSTGRARSAASSVSDQASARALHNKASDAGDGVRVASSLRNT